MEDERALVAALAIVVGVVGAVTWWRWRSLVVRLLRAILAELERSRSTNGALSGPESDESGSGAMTTADDPPRAT